MTVALCLLTAFAITFLALPSVIQVARIKNLYDVPTERSSHSKNTPSLGGVGIFAGAVFSIIFWTDFQSSSNMKYALCSMIIMACPMRLDLRIFQEAITEYLNYQ